MCYKKPLLFFVFLVISLNAFCTVFTVTSNADSGTGTLRDALTQAAANGTATTDYIYFNLPDQSQAGRTIILQSQLPLISSNTVIDGTTQPGSNFGVSNAKVILQPVTTSSVFDAFVLLNVDNFQLYGMYVRDFFGVAPFNVSAVVYVSASSNIQIGAPGKGNVFANVGYVVGNRFAYYYDDQNLSGDGVENLTVCSNFIGFEPDGKTYRGTPDGYSGGLELSACKGTITIGGDDISKRNIFGNCTMAVSCRNISADKAYPSTFLIENNYINYNVDGQFSPLPVINSSDIFSIFTQADPANTFNLPYAFSIINNKIQFTTDIIINPVSGKIVFQGNQVVNNPNRNGGYESEALFFSTDAILIGGVNPGEANSLYDTPVVAGSPISVLVQHNSIYCSYSQIPYTNSGNPIPNVNITNVTTNSISGTATPNAKIELFWDDDCQTCNPFTYITTVAAGANGLWTYSGVINKAVVASATLGPYTSEFTTAATLQGGNVTHAACGNNGSITGGTYQNSGGYQWENSSGAIIGNTPDINNLAPGTYTLTALNGSCSTNYSFTIFDATPKIDASQKKIIQPSCGKNTGSITGLYLDNYDVINEAEGRGEYNTYSYQWIDSEGAIVGNQSDLVDVVAGSYTLIVQYKNTCPVRYGPVVLKNVTGPTVDQSNATKQSTNCGQSTGSITGIAATGTGTLKFIWWNSEQQTVGTSLDLLNQPAGTYKLEVTDDSQCGPVYTTDLTIPETNGITMDESKAQPAVASCNNNNGSVTGITVTGATQYQWLDANNKVVGTAADLQNVAPGTYTLTASNSFGCVATSKAYTVGQLPPTKFPVYAASTVPACFQGTDGSVTVAVDALVKSVRWVNAGGQDAGGKAALTNVGAGAYQLYLTDQNGCENYYDTYTIDQLPQFAVTNNGTTANDECTLGTGSVSGITVAGGAPPYAYTWYDANNTVVGTGTSITNLYAGTYTLNVTDARCGDIKLTYQLTNESEDIAGPSVSDVALCSSGSAVIKVNNASSSTIYNLYTNLTDTQPAEQRKGGIFIINVTGNTHLYFSQLEGTCESPRTDISVTVGLSALNIANTFTPNGDGINDFWVIDNITSYPAAEVQVFTRNGQRIFDSKGYATPFDGTFNGKKLPEGVYYYIIDLHSNCSLLSGSLTIIR